MTFSLLVRDPATGRLGGAAATGSLCVGGWVLRGDPRAGLSASQGTAPSTLWGEEVLDRMRGGAPAERAVTGTVAPDTGRAHRQLAALDAAGGAGAFTGAESVPACTHRSAPGAVAAGNMLTSPRVLDALLESWRSGGGALADRLLAALDAAEAAGSDSRGLLSAALLIVGADMAPLTLRIDRSETPLADLRALLGHTRTPPYGDWLNLVPTLEAPHRAPV